MSKRLRDIPNLRLSLVLGFAASISICLLFPYLVILIPKFRTLSIPLWLLVPLEALQGGVQMVAYSWVGLRVGQTLGLGAPLLAARLAG